eukprot:CAMPEP_0196747598 /NCGR_PEP_ID=MMETSP1091-20130531/70485_1 /TAXON_ID=302021 /ORGANISM="Rhodomonas sp., Strain CCMP768" /LENGTH=86 /DNA_ID=CAMNT_0042094783 /DNA_START=59 /DNA_END=319 /DNA_ORIENTATION=+
MGANKQSPTRQLIDSFLEESTTSDHEGDMVQGSDDAFWDFIEKAARNLQPSAALSGQAAPNRISMVLSPSARLHYNRLQSLGGLDE